MQNAIDYEADVEIKVTDDQIKQIALLADHQRLLEKNIELQQGILEELTKQHRRLSETDLPNAMQEAGMTEFKLTDGTQIKIKPEVYASIPKAAQREAYRWLDEHKFGDIIKSKVEVAFGRDQRDAVKNLVAVIEGAGFDNYSTRESIHAGTLNAFVREQLEAGVTLPQELFSVHRVSKAVIK